jgi:ribosomal-protein-alanine N-acetyltransferase
VSNFRLETERLVIREWQPEDFAAFRPIAIDPEVVKYIGKGKPWSDERIEAFIQQQIREQREDGYCMWPLVWKEDGRLIGFCGIQPWQESGEIEIGWWLAKEYWGRGLATEAARTALAYAFEGLNLRRIIAIIHQDNSDSKRVAQKLGMRFERAALVEGVPVHIYSIEKTDGT